MKALLAVVVTFALLTVSAHAASLVTAPAPPRPEASDLGWLKYVVLAFGLAGVLPLAAWIRRYRSIGPVMWTLMGLLPFAQAAVRHLNIALASFSWPGVWEWPGYVKEFEFSAMDLIALALYLVLPRTRDPLPFRLSMVFYFATVLLSSFQAVEPVAALFYPWQLLRIYLVYAVVSKSCADARFVPALFTGMAIGLCFEACVVIWQRFGLSMVHTTGTFGHQNTLGLVSHFVVFPYLALLLAGRWRGPTLAALAAGAIVAVLTASRATIALAGLGYIIQYTLSVLRRPTQWKAIIGVIGAAGVVVLGLAAESSLERRFEAERLTTRIDEREAFKSAAARILEDHPMGIGANNYAFVATTEGYSRQSRVVAIDLAQSPHVHNVYWLTAAETGYIGLVAFVLLLLHPLITAFVCGWQNRKDRRSELLLGLGVALLIVYVHSYFEWALMTLEVQYFWAMTLGMVAGLAQQLGYWRRDAVRGKRLDAFGGLTRRKSLIRPQGHTEPLRRLPPAE